MNYGVILLEQMDILLKKTRHDCTSPTSTNNESVKRPGLMTPVIGIEGSRYMYVRNMVHQGDRKSGSSVS